MRVIDINNALDEVAQLIIKKAQYQKVVVCVDEQSNMEFIDRLTNIVNKKVVWMKYYYNNSNTQTFFNLINNGVRVVLYNVSVEHFYKLQTE